MTTETLLKHPEVIVELVGQDGNGFGMVSRTRTAMRRAGVPADEQEAFFADALSGDYDHLLQTIFRWVTVE